MLCVALWVRKHPVQTTHRRRVSLCTELWNNIPIFRSKVLIVILSLISDWIVNRKSKYTSLRWKTKLVLQTQIPLVCYTWSITWWQDVSSVSNPSEQNWRFCVESTQARRQGSQKQQSFKNPTETSQLQHKSPVKVHWFGCRRGPCRSELRSRVCCRVNPVVWILPGNSYKQQIKHVSQPLYPSRLVESRFKTSYIRRQDSAVNWNFTYQS